MHKISVTLNAHLLAAGAGYRSAGIHGYIYHTLAHLPAAAPDWDFRVLVGEGQPPSDIGLTVQRARFKTSSPLRRIFWEQAIQPLILRHAEMDLYHGMAFVLPWGLNAPSIVNVNIPSIVTIYDLSFLHYPQALSAARRLYLKLMTRRSCQQATRIIAISESTAQDIVQSFGIPRHKINVAVPGVSPAFRPLAPDEVAAFRIKNNLPERFILHLGTLEPRKNLPMLIEAYAALPFSVREAVPLILAGGKGWDFAPIFETIARYNLGEQVRHVGYVMEEDLPYWYNAAALLAYPSLYEGWGLPVTEAMVCACPTLVSDTSSLPEAAGDTGLRLPPNDPTAWTAALEHALNDSAWRAESAQAGLVRAQGFTWVATAQATISAYEMALSEGRR